MLKAETTGGRLFRWMLLLAFTASLGAFATSPAFADDKEGDDELADLMSTINRSYKKIRRTIKDDAKKEHNLENLKAMIEAATGAAKHEPPMAKKMKGEEKKKFLAAYKKAMMAMVADIEKLVAMVKEGGKGDAAYDQLKKVYGHKKSGHNEFTEE